MYGSPNCPGRAHVWPGSHSDRDPHSDQKREGFFQPATRQCGSRVRNQFFCPVCSVVADGGQLVRGYEVAKGEYVRLTNAELEALEAEANSAIQLKEFIPVSKVDPVYFEHAYYLSPGEGGESLR